MKQLTPEELQQAIGAFLIVLGKNMPPELSRKMAEDLRQLAEQITQGGEPNAGAVAKGFALALSGKLPARERPDH